MKKLIISTIFSIILSVYLTLSYNRKNIVLSFEVDKIGKFKIEYSYIDETKNNLTLTKDILADSSINIITVELSNKLDNIIITGGKIKNLTFKNLKHQVELEKITYKENSIEGKDLGLKGKKYIQFNIYMFTISFTVFLFLFLLVNDKTIDSIFQKWNGESNYYKNIDALRFILSIGIVATHLGMAKYGVVYVEFFFVISGFMLYRTIENSYNISEKDFFVKRYLRLFPSYLLLILLCQPKAFFQSAIGFDIVFERQFTSRTIGALWFVPIVFWGGVFIFSLFKNFQKQANFILAIITYLSLYYMYSIEGNYYYSPVTSFTCLLRGVSYMSIGYFLHLFSKNFKLTNGVNNFFLTFIEFFIFIFLIKKTIIEPYPIILILMVFCCLIYLFVERKGFISKLLNNNVSALLGKYSYSIYLTHGIITLYYKKISVFETVNDILGKIIVLVLITPIVGVLFYYLLEKPTGDWLINKYRKLNVNTNQQNT